MEISGKNLRFASADEILQFAIEKEQEAKTFYEIWAGKVKSEGIREVLLEFAGEEQKHKELLQNVKAGQSFKMPESKIIDLQLGDYFVPVEAQESMTYEDALRIAIQREIGANRLYTYLASIAGSQQAKSLFERLAVEESKHKMRLESLYDEDILKEN